MRRAVAVAAFALASVAGAGPALAGESQPGPGCDDFGRYVAGLASGLPPGAFGANARDEAPLRDLVAAEQQIFCGTFTTQGRHRIV